VCLHGPERVYTDAGPVMDAAYVCADGVLPRVDAVKMHPRVKLCMWGKSGRTDDESGQTDKMEVRTVIFA
jgi:hypothetical protein